MFSNEHSVCNETSDNKLRHTSTRHRLGLELTTVAYICAAGEDTTAQLRERKHKRSALPAQLAQCGAQL